LKSEASLEFEIYSDDKEKESITSNGEHRTLSYYYTKYQYKKIVRRLKEDPSSMWYDNLEQMRKDYADLKEIYDLICAPNPYRPSNQPV
jgi:hypothetical protein